MVEVLFTFTFSSFSVFFFSFFFSIGRIKKQLRDARKNKNLHIHHSDDKTGINGNLSLCWGNGNRDSKGESSVKEMMRMGDDGWGHLTDGDWYRSSWRRRFRHHLRIIGDDSGEVDGCCEERDALGDLPSPLVRVKRLDEGNDVSRSHASTNRSRRVFDLLHARSHDRD